MDTHPTAPGLPETAYAVHLESGALVIIARGETGYHPYADPHPHNEATAAHLNGRMGVTPAQAAAMFLGSLMGWHVPGADPANYTEDGKPRRVTEPGWIAALRAQGYSVGQDHAGFYRWVHSTGEEGARADQTSVRRVLTEGDAWAGARTHHNLTRGRQRPLI